jgi:rhomboid protease GluP
LFGGLLGFLIVHHSRIPAAVLGPMRSSALGFLGYNVLFGLTSEKIDMAGHLGGLVTGFVAGLLLTMASNSASHSTRAIRVVSVVAVLSAGLWLLAVSVIGIAHGRILADPKIGPLVRSQIEAAPSYNDFLEASKTPVDELDATGREIDQLINTIDREIAPRRQVAHSIEGLIAKSNRLGDRIKEISARNDEIRAMRECLISARKFQAEMLQALERFVVSSNPASIDDANGFRAIADKYVKELTRLTELRRAYFETHHLTELPK